MAKTKEKVVTRCEVCDRPMRLNSSGAWCIKTGKARCRSCFNLEKAMKALDNAHLR